jgi:hypothetical protein
MGGPVGGCAPGALPAVTGHAYYAVGDEVFRIEAAAGAAPENVSAVLSAVAPGGRDRFVSASGNGAWIVMSSEKAGCGGECLARVPGDLSAVEPVLAGGAEVYVEGGSAIDDTGDRIVFSAKGGPHEVDLWLTERSGGAWGAPALLTGASTYTFNNMPAMNREGTHVVFDCGQNPYPEDGANDACEVALDGTGFRRVVGPDTLPDARFDKVQNPHPGPDGVLFEASWPVEGDSPELIWRLPACGGEPEPIGRAFPNAVSPCALADGTLRLSLARATGQRRGGARTDPRRPGRRAHHRAHPGRRRRRHRPRVQRLRDALLGGRRLPGRGLERGP